MAFLKAFVPQNMKDLKKEDMELEKLLNHWDIFSTIRASRYSTNKN